MIAWLKCLLLGHPWEVRSHGPDRHPGERAAWEAWEVCTRCGADTRQAWEIQDDNEIRLERVAMEIRKRNP